MKAVHFGAGNIGRGFVGLLLHEGGYELVFSDVAASLVDAINAASEYTVHEVGDGGTDTVVTGFRAINSATDPQALIDEIADRRRRDHRGRPDDPALRRAAHPRRPRPARPVAPPLQVMACENAIGATDTLRDEIREQAGDAWDAISNRAVFANTAVDRIVPAQPEGAGIDVTVEPVLRMGHRTPPSPTPAHIPGAHFVDDLAPIERKLFTVNTGRRDRLLRCPRGRREDLRRAGGSVHRSPRGRRARRDLRTAGRGARMGCR
jgi:mannitol-1-phosphate 5-dehydrogenase